MSALTTSAALDFVLLEQKYFPAPETLLLQKPLPDEVFMKLALMCGASTIFTFSD